MCIIIVNKKDNILSDEILTGAFVNNPDGAGFMYSVNNKLKIVKGIFNLEEFKQVYKKLKKIAKSDLVIHCRIATTGLINKTNCHPHKINNTIGMVHNGVSLIDTTKNSKKSDTILFIEKYLKLITSNDLHSITFKKILNDFINIKYQNKLVLMDNTGFINIINETQGFKDNKDNWFSNCNYFLDDISNQKDICSKYEEKEVIKNINKLTFNDFLKIQDTPIINLETLNIVSIEDITNNYDFISLEELSTKLYDKYISKMYMYCN